MITCKLYGASGEKTLSDPSYLYYNRSVNYAADGLRIVFPGAEFDVGYNYVELYMDDKKLFEGIIDSVNTQILENSKTTSIAARSLVGAALDSEAKPGTHEVMYLSGAFENYMKPYGFTLNVFDMDPYVSQFIVNKGLSDYGAFEKFFFYTPYHFYIDGNNIYVASRTASKTITASNKGGVPYKSLALKSQPNQIINTIYIRDEYESYSTEEINTYPSRAYYNKKRYMIPEENNVYAAAKKAVAAITDSSQNAVGVSACLIGFVELNLGDYIYFTDVEALRETRFVVNSITIKTDKDKVYTEINSVQKVDY